MHHILVLSMNFEITWAASSVRARTDEDVAVMQIRKEAIPAGDGTIRSDSSHAAARGFISPLRYEEGRFSGGSEMSLDLLRSPTMLTTFLDSGTTSAPQYALPHSLRQIAWNDLPAPLPHPAWS